MFLLLKIMIILSLQYITLLYINIFYQKNIIVSVLYLDDQDFLNIILISLYEYSSSLILELFYIHVHILIHDELLDEQGL